MVKVVSASYGCTKVFIHKIKKRPSRSTCGACGMGEMRGIARLEGRPDMSDEDLPSCFFETREMAGEKTVIENGFELP